MTTLKVTVLAALAAVAMCLVACGGDAKPSDTPPAPSGDPSAAPAADPSAAPAADPSAAPATPPAQ